MTQGHIAPLDGTPPIADPSRGVTLPTDDLYVVVAPPDTPVLAHPAWHDVILVCGPYLVTGRMPTMPGFDPARALARPTGSFVLLDHVKLSLVSEPDGGSIEHELAWVNRYVVERVERPGARLLLPRRRVDLVQDTYTPAPGSIPPDQAGTRNHPGGRGGRPRRPARTPSRPRATRPPDRGRRTRRAGQTGGG